MTPAPPLLRTAVAVAAGCAAGLALLAVLLARWPAGPLPATAAAWTAVLLGWVAAVAAGTDRWRREPHPARWVVLLGTAGVAALMAVEPADAWPLLTAGVLLALLAAVAVLTWAPPLQPHERRPVISDAVIGALGLALIWVAVVLPAASAPPVTLVALAVDFVAALAVLLLAAAGRRRRRLPIGQVIALHLSVLWLVGGDVVANVFTGTDDVVATALRALTVTVAGASFTAFAVGAADARESPRLLWLRDAWSVIIPLSPLPIAAAVLLFTLATGQAPSPAAAAGVAVILLLVIIGVLALRLSARAEHRRASVTVAIETFSQASAQGWFQALIGNSRDLVFVTDRSAHTIYASPSARTLLGAADPVGRLVEELAPGLALAAIREAQHRPGHAGLAVDSVLVDRAGGEHEVQFRVAPLVGLGIDGFVLTGQDVTDTRRLRVLLGESRRRDRATGLLNADAFTQAVADAHHFSDTGHLAVLMFEICDLRLLNDVRGHQVADAVIRVVAARLEQAGGPILAVARVRYEAFAVLVRDHQPDLAVGELVSWLRQQLRVVSLGDLGPIRLRLACGYVVGGAAAVPAGTLLRQADLAATRAMAGVHPVLVRYEPEMQAELLAHLEQLSELESALERGEFLPHYQPIVRLSDGMVVSVEALARRVLPGGGIQQPDDFIPLAERAGLVSRVDAAIRTAALADIRRLRQRWPQLTVSINIAPSVFASGYAENLLREVALAGLPPHAVTFEVTESTVAESDDLARQILTDLRARGCQVALDDFGTGYSSLEALRSLSVDVLKIDQAFVVDLATSARTLAVTRAITELGRGLHLITVAEGVRSVEQADLLRGMGCDRVQGYLHAGPMALELLERWLGGRVPQLNR